MPAACCLPRDKDKFLERLPPFCRLVNVTEVRLFGVVYKFWDAEQLRRCSLFWASNNLPGVLTRPILSFPRYSWQYLGDAIGQPMPWL